jgi:hypothetical protein
MLLFIAIETAPVFVKLISARGPYDDLLEAHEHAYIIFRKEQIEKRERTYRRKMMPNPAQVQAATTSTS